MKVTEPKGPYHYTQPHYKLEKTFLILSELKQLLIGKYGLTYGVLSPKGEGQVWDEKKKSAHRRVVPRSSTLSSNASKCENAEGKRRKVMNQIKGQIAKCVVLVLRVFGDIVLELEGFKTKTTKSIVGGYWVVVGSAREIVHPRLSPTLSAGESEWAKAEAVLKCGNSVFERNRVDSG
ncbi:hypothetical protein H5410_014812 [Solanum commersonii]|uniref:Uncharacterized protein n=1 Tax=Solanum commersonii TaxID=4109 RepID=A0A9J5ZSJ3_SOLCO|nr:hypothetical protein H5410_014812 [Solanum commersonii]